MRRSTVGNDQLGRTAVRSCVLTYRGHLPRCKSDVLVESWMREAVFLSDIGGHPRPRFFAEYVIVGEKASR